MESTTSVGSSQVTLHEGEGFSLSYGMHRSLTPMLFRILVWLWTTLETQVVCRTRRQFSSPSQQESPSACLWEQRVGSCVSRSVTSCAGMTAKVTIIAQTRIGFLSGVRRIAQGEGAEEAFHLQLEEAAARATVAFTRAREVCVILGPLDMLGLLGAATVVGSLMYGLGINT